MKPLITLAFILVCALTKAQVNFVLNPDFEQYGQCPELYDHISLAEHWSSIDSIGYPNCASEYCNVCAISANTDIPLNGFFYQFPHSGNGFAQAIMFFDESFPWEYGRNYTQGRLHSNLIAGHTYCVSFYVNLAEISMYAIGNIGAYLDDGSIDTTSICGYPQVYYSPQIVSDTIMGDTLNWVKIEGSFMAGGNEKFITIGNFSSASNTDRVQLFHPYGTGTNISAYLIDDVSVIDRDLPAYAGNDTTIIAGDSVFVGRIPEVGLNCTWYVNGSVVDSGAGIWVTPNGTTVYVVKQVVCGVVKTDTVTVTVISASVNGINSRSKVNIYPNPATTELNVSGAKDARISIHNSLGQYVYQGLTNSSAVTRIDIKDLPAGVYYVIIEADGVRIVRRLAKF